ncbi:hypothetical protein COV19_00770 [Candidatus Woesearchaeota archaeon CG10_big_fil_rev_8_21_14_0_10_44_13]|nr:MAG: hypothetical protein COV19_00770 [Candidatus Woesearchaeota archaeon CG10_big_fil_rev_8_21_14_0_10_44_13]
MERLTEKERKEKIKKSLKYSILDGSFYAAMVGFGESFFSAFAVFLKATNTQLGLLGTLPQTLGSLSQLFSNRLIRFFSSRKRFVLAGVLLEALVFIPIALVFFFGTLRVFHLIFFVCLYWVLGMIIVPAWSSWMGDLVDEKKRGDYFGRRNRITGMIMLITFLLGGYVLQSYADGTTRQYAGFLMIFGIAMLARFVSFIYLAKKYEPEYRIVKKDPFTFMEFVKKASHRNYGLFVIFLCFMNFAVYVATPFFSAYMLYDLKFSYMTYAIISAIAVLVKYLSMPAWGRASDRYGTKKVMTLASYLMPLVPLLWVFSRDVYFLVFVQIYSGFTWAGFEITTFNFIFDTTTPEKRATCVSYYNVLNGIFIFLGGIMGSIILKYNHILSSQYYSIFILSFGLRYITSFHFIPKLKEVRQVQHISYKKLLTHIISSTPNMGHVQHLLPLHGKKGKMGRSRL